MQETLPLLLLFAPGVISGLFVQALLFSKFPSGGSAAPFSLWPVLIGTVSSSDPRLQHPVLPKSHVPPPGNVLPTG